MQEIDFYEDFQAICGPDAMNINQRWKSYRVFNFLAGLIPEFDQTRTQILGRDPLFSP